MWTTPEFKVGALLLALSTLIGFMSFTVSEPPTWLTGGYCHWFRVPEATGLIEKGRVNVAGIHSGIVQSIRLDQGQARIDICLDRGVRVYKNGSIEIRSSGVLGDRYVEVVPGTPSSGTLTDGEQIKTSAANSSVDMLIDQVGQISGSLSKIAKMLDRATQDGGDDSTPIGRTIINLETLTQNLADLSDRNKAKVNTTIDRFARLSRSLENLLNEHDPAGFYAGIDKLSNSLHRLDAVLENAQSITDKINEGQGTVAQLINDEKTIENVHTALDNVNDFFGSMASLETTIDYHSKYMFQHQLASSNLNIKVQPGLDRYYEVGLVSQMPIATQQLSAGESNELKWNAFMAKNFYNVTLRGGLIESQAAAGVDYNLFKNNLKLSLEAIGFGHLNLRTLLRYNLIKGVYVVGGGDNLLQPQRSGFVGAGVYLTNDDLKLLASKISF